MKKESIYEKYVKRSLDFILSLIAIILFSPIFIIISILIKCTSKGPVFFLQKRLGENGKEFNIIKFRTMIPNAENIGDGLKVKSEKDNRITPIGRFLRKTSLDELPQLFNVLYGNMSLIGPRPPVTYHPYKYENYSSEQKKRFLVKPGISGLAQVRVRNSVSWDERINIDIEYVEKISFFEDVKIIFETIKQVLGSKSIYSNEK